ncbi:GNAT family N-acetyltransferase [Actinomycetota bacterium Odt1-20B]
MRPAASGQLTVSRASLDDWNTVVRGWAAGEGWNPGLRDADAFFAQDPEGFFLGRVDGEPVSAISVVNYGERYAFLGFYLVRPDRRGRGHGHATWKAALAHAGDRTVGLDGVVAQQDNYRRSGFEFVHRTLRFAGRVPAGEGRAAGPRRHVLPVDSVERAAVTAYDSACYPADRPHFVEAWLGAPGHRALVRVVDGRVTGYGVARPADEGVKIGPLFADTRADAEALFDALTASEDGGLVMIDVPEPHAEAVALVQQRGFEPVFETARMYTGPVREFAQEKVFGVTTLELG